MPDSLCRLTVQHGGNDGCHAVDLALPINTSVGQLMPAIVDIIHRDAFAPVTGRLWRLSRVGGPPLDESLTLDDNEIRDGELLLLTATESPAPEWVVFDPSHTAARVENADGESPTQMLPTICCVFISGIVAAALIWTAAGTAAAGNLITCAGLAAAAAVGAVVAWRTHADPLLSVPLSLAAVIFTATAGFLAVPAGPREAHVLLASAAAFSATILLLRLIGCGTSCLTAVATVTILTTTVAAASVAWQLRTNAAGASLATLSLAMLGVAPRFAIAVTGIGPSTPSLDDVDEPAPVVDTARATLTHHVLTGLVTGTSISAALGAAMVGLGYFRGGGSSLSAAAFTAVIGLVLLLRARTHADATRRIALVVGGTMSATAGFAIAVVSAPAHAHLFSALAAVAGFAALSRRVGLAFGPLLLRTVEVVDYLALAAVVPMACWVGGLYGVVRGMGLL